MLTGILIIATLLAVIVFGPKARPAWAQLGSGNHAEIQAMRHGIHVNRKATNWLRSVKCRPLYRFRYNPVSEYPVYRLKGGLNVWRNRRYDARHASSVCPTIHHLSLWLCVHAHEGRWDDPNPPYWGGLQMSWGFMEAHAPGLLRRKGTADHWTPREQMAVADRAYHQADHSSGWLNGQWPGTRSECGA